MIRLFLGIMTVVLLLEAVIFGAERLMNAVSERQRHVLAAAENQVVLAEQYERATYLAVGALATSDWDLLLAQRRTAAALSARFVAISDALARQRGHHAVGARAHILVANAVSSGMGVRDRYRDTGRVIGMMQASGGQAGTGMGDAVWQSDPRMDEVLRTVSQQWKRVLACHGQLLRADNHELHNNPVFDDFRVATAVLMDALQQILAIARAEYDDKMDLLNEIRTAMPAALLVMTLLIALLAFRGLLMPLGDAIDELGDKKRQLSEQREAEAALRCANDQLEKRVEECTRELREAQSQLVDAALTAGKAELATNILHNVGNVLNGANVLNHQIRDRLGEFHWNSLEKVVALINRHRDDLAGFFSRDPRGRRIPEYLEKFAAQKLREHTVLGNEVERLGEHLEHIRCIVSMQQEHAKSANTWEETSYAAILDTAIGINLPAIDRHGIEVRREFADIPRQRLKKHQILQVVINLIKNATYAMAEVEPARRTLTVRLVRGKGQMVRIEVADNGCGIAPERMDKLFQRGFSTREGGHGFGLHGSRLAATDLGGTLRAQSAGADRGATFVLELPLAG